MASRSVKKIVSRLSPDDRTADIMAAARVVISQKGYEKTLLSDIAEQAGIVEGTIYRYFENKRALLIRVAEVWFGEQLAIDSHLASIDGTQNKLRYLAWRTMDIIRREPVLARFMLMELRADPNYKGTPFFGMNKTFTHETLLVCREAIARGEFADDVSPKLLRDMLHGCIEHSTWNFLRGEGEFNIDELADSIARVIYRGMAVRPMEQGASGDIGRAVARLERVAERIERKLGSR